MQPAATITKEELLGMNFLTNPKDSATAALTIGKDGSWLFNMGSTKLAGGSFEIAERMQLWGDKEGQIAVFGERGGPGMRLTEELRAKIEAQLSSKVSGDYVMTFFYGSIGDGQAIYLFGGKN